MNVATGHDQSPPTSGSGNRLPPLPSLHNVEHSHGQDQNIETRGGRGSPSDTTTVPGTKSSEVKRHEAHSDKDNRKIGQQQQSGAPAPPQTVQGSAAVEDRRPSTPRLLPLAPGQAPSLSTSFEKATDQSTAAMDSSVGSVSSDRTPSESPETVNGGTAHIAPHEELIPSSKVADTTHTYRSSGKESLPPPETSGARAGKEESMTGHGARGDEANGKGEPSSQDQSSSSNGTKSATSNGNGVGVESGIEMHPQLSNKGISMFNSLNRVESHKSWGYFGMEHPLRKRCLRLIHGGLDQFILAVVLINCVFIILQEELSIANAQFRSCATNSRHADGWDCAVSLAELVFTVIYTLEFIIKSIAVGLYQWPTSYLRDSWNIMDVTVLVASYAGLAFMIFEVDQQLFAGGALVIFRMFRVLRAFRTVQKVDGLRVLVNSLIKAVPLLLRVVSMFTLLIIMFTILALNLFHGRLTMRCVPHDLLPEGFERDDPLFPRALILDYVVDQVSLDQRNSLSGCAKQSDCGEGGVCLKLENPYHRYLNFDNFGYSLVAIFQCITGEGWSDVMYRVWESTSYWSILFFMTVGVVGTNLIMNLLLAVIKESLTRVMTQMIKHNQDRKLNALRLATITTNLNITGLSPSIALEKMGLATKSGLSKMSKHLTNSQFDMADDGKIIYLGRSPSLKTVANTSNFVIEYFKSFANVCSQIAQSKWFVLLSMTLVFVNTIFLSTTYSGMDKDVYETLELVSTVMTVFFAVESTIKIIGFGPKKFLQNTFDVFDLVVVSIGLVEMIIVEINRGTDSTDNDNRLKITALRAVRVLRLGRVARILKLARYLDTIRAAGEVLRQSMKVFMYMVVLISLFTFIFSVVGMILFKDFYVRTPPEQLLAPRSNFVTFYNSILAVFQVLTLEGWTMLMWDAMKSNQSAGSIFYILWVILGPYILLALLASGVLDNFEREYFEQRRLQRARRLQDKEKKKADKGDQAESPKNLFTDPKALVTGMKEALNSALANGMGSFPKNKVLPKADSIELEERQERASHAGTPTHAGGLEDPRGASPPSCEKPAPAGPPHPRGSGAEPGLDREAVVRYFFEDQGQPLYKWRMPAELVAEMLTQLGRTPEPADYIRMGEQLGMRVEADPSNPAKVRFVDGETVFLELLVKYILDSHNPNTPMEYHADASLLCPREAADELDLAFSCWSTYDQDASGCINVRELEQVIGAFSKQSNSHNPEQVSELMLGLDIDGDGEVTFLEFLKAKNHVNSEGSVAQILGIQQIQQMRQVFDMFDEDGSGNIDKDELEKVMNTLGLSMSRWELSQLMLQMDYDDSGQINWFEFIRGMAKISRQNIADDEEAHLAASVGNHEKRKDLELAKLSQDTSSKRFTTMLNSGTLGGKRWVDAIAFGSELSREDSRQFKESQEKSKNKRKRKPFIRRRSKRHIPIEGKSLYIFAASHPLRMFLHKLVSHPIFEWVILLLIILSSVVLALDGPRTSDKWKSVLIYVELAFTITFTFEMVVKIIVLGLWSGPKAYLKSRWNQLDAVIVINSLISVILHFITNQEGLAFLRTVRLVRALRPLRAVSRGSKLRIVVNTLLQSAIAIVNIAAMVLFVGYIFSIIGLEFFAGGFRHCQGGGIFYSHVLEPLDDSAVLAWRANSTWTNEEDWTVCALEWSHMQSVDYMDTGGNYTCFFNAEECEAASGAAGSCSFVPTYEPHDNFKKEGFNSQQACEAMGYRWVDRIINFNNIGQVTISLFIVATGEGWVDMMHWSTDIAARLEDDRHVMPMNVQIEQDRTPAAALYYVLYISVTNFFLLRLFTGAVYTFYIQQRDSEENGFLTKSQREWIGMQMHLHEELHRIQPPAKKFAWQKHVQRVLESDRCKMTIAAIIVIQCLFMMSATDEMSRGHHRLLQGMTVTVTLVLLIEITAKISVYGLDMVQRNKWLRYDCLVLALALMEMVIIFVTVINPEYLGTWGYREVSLVTLRLLRVGRFFRHTVYVTKATMLVRTIKKLQIILETFLTSLPALLNMLIILLVFYFIFGVLGMNVFGEHSVGSETGGVHAHANFEDFGMSILTLFRVSTGEDWQDVYHDLVWLQCEEKQRYYSPDRCGNVATFVFFLSFFLVNVFIIMNLFVAIMIEIFAGVVSREYSDLAMEHVSDWVGIWSASCEFGEDGRSFMGPSQFKQFIRQVPEPLGVGRNASEPVTLQRIHDLRVNVDKGRVLFDTPLYQAVKRVAKALNPATRSTNNIHLSDEYIDTSYMGVLMDDLVERRNSRSLNAEGSGSTAPSPGPGPLNVNEDFIMSGTESEEDGSDASDDEGRPEEANNASRSTSPTPEPLPPLAGRSGLPAVGGAQCGRGGAEPEARPAGAGPPEEPAQSRGVGESYEGTRLNSLGRLTPDGSRWGSADMGGLGAYGDPPTRLSTISIGAISSTALMEFERQVTNRGESDRGGLESTPEPAHPPGKSSGRYTVVSAFSTPGSPMCPGSPANSVPGDPSFSTPMKQDELHCASNCDADSVESVVWS